MVALFNEGYTIRYPHPQHLFDRVRQENVIVHSAQLLDPKGHVVMTFQSDSRDDAGAGLVQKVNEKS